MGRLLSIVVLSRYKSTALSQALRNDCFLVGSFCAFTGREKVRWREGGVWRLSYPVYGWNLNSR